MAFQRRTLDRVTVTDFTQNFVGDEVVIRTAKLVACPGCGRPALVLPITENLVLHVHKADAAGEPTEVCAPVDDGEPELVILDAAGEPVYSGPAELPAGSAN